MNKKILYFGVKTLPYPIFVEGYIFCNSTDTRKHILLAEILFLVSILHYTKSFLIGPDIRQVLTHICTMGNR